MMSANVWRQALGIPDQYMRRTRRAVNASGHRQRLRGFMTQIDMPRCVQHPTFVQSIRTAAQVLTLALALVTNLVAQCAGGGVSPEARMACCKEGIACPMHGSESEGSGTRTVSQAQADSCCGTSNDRLSGPTSSILVASLLAPAGTLEPLPPASPTFDRWRTPVPLDTSPVSKHVLLATFLI